MNLLLDTHIILWLASDGSKLSIKAKRALADENNVRYVSIVSAWEYCQSPILASAARSVALCFEKRFQFCAV